MLYTIHCYRCRTLELFTLTDLKFEAEAINWRLYSKAPSMSDCHKPRNLLTGMNVSTQATAGEEILSKREENRCQADAFVSAGHVIAADFLEGENNQGGGASTVFSSVLNIVVNKFIDYADGTQGFEQESKGVQFSII